MENTLKIYNQYTNQPIMTISIYPYLNEMNIYGWHFQDTAEEVIANNEAGGVSVNFLICNN